MLSNTQIVIILLIIFAGIYIYIRIAQNDSRQLMSATGRRWKLNSFFLAGGRLGPDLTEHNTVGMTFAWSGGIWFFATLAYQSGPWVLTSQIFWSLSIIALACLLPKIITQLRGHTIHGFLARHYGRPTQRIAAVATTCGYIINGGFEIFWSSLLFALCIGRADLALPIALALAGVVGVYCMIGGYRSNATVDKPHNMIGVASLALLTWFVTDSLNIGGGFRLGVQLFAVGSGIYFLISLLLYVRWLQIPESFLNSVAAIFGIGAFVIVFSVLSADSADSGALQKIVVNTPAYTYVIVATVSFQVFFNLVDMQNWQQIAANENEEPKKYWTIAWSIIRASIYLMWFPALGGILIGCALRAASGTVTDESLFPIAFSLVMPDSGDGTRAIVLGFLLLGFISTSMSTVDSLLISALQTIWYDILYPAKVEQLLASTNEDEEEAFVGRARAFLIPIAMVMALLFYGIWAVYGGAVLLFQPLMYAYPLALLGPVLLALFWPELISQTLGNVIFVGISVAVLAVTSMFVVSSLPNQTEEIKNWLPSLMPLIANAMSLMALTLGLLFIFIRKFIRKRLPTMIK